MKEYHFEAPVVLGFTVQAESEIETRKVAADLAIGRIDFTSIPDATLGGRPPHLTGLVTVFDPSRPLPIMRGRPARPAKG